MFVCLRVGSIFPSHRPSDAVFKITFWLGYFNSCLNPIIYTCFSQEFKKAFQNVLKGCCLCRTTAATPLTRIAFHPAPPSCPVTHSAPQFTQTGANQMSKSFLKACCFSARGRSTSTETRHVFVDMKGMTAGQAVWDMTNVIVMEKLDYTDGDIKVDTPLLKFRFLWCKKNNK